ncbi:hypothetical protein AB6A40_009541 [Gnathostoma spinigerum]|uniref:sphinganine-1-phosphate aldolase n=1 Tax=Gnathostoma spinigerum TaxID=75299 RepID=A0ABD6F0V0_9BILA
MSLSLTGVFVNIADIFGKSVEKLNDELSKISPLKLVLCTIGSTLTFLHIHQIIRRSDRPISQRFLGEVFRLIRRIPRVQAEIDEKLDEARKSIIEIIHKSDSDRTFITDLPVQGMRPERIIATADSYEQMATDSVEMGRVSGAVYTDYGKEHLDVLEKIFRKYAYANPLHPDVFPGVRKMEAEVVRMVCGLYHGGPESCGTLSSGGTESILLAMLAYRTRARSSGISDPQMLVPVTAHAAFDKAAELFRIRIRHIPLNERHQVDLKLLEKSIDSETCVIVGSAPNFPSGTIDDICALSELGERYKVPVHVDACLGGFLIPFMEEAGFTTPLFDFRLPGVTSISCDTHKYGFAPKGSSVIMYRNKSYLHYQYFCVPEWSGGIYATPTLAGSRCGSATALTWATMLFYGRKGYVQRTKEIITLTRFIASCIEGTHGRKPIKGLQLLGPSDVSVVAFTSTAFNIYTLADRMSGRGWNLNALQNPPAVHLCVTANTVTANSAEAFINDLREVSEVLLNEPQKKGASETAAIYGMAASIPDKSVVNEVAFSFLDACYAMPAKKSNDDN